MNKEVETYIASVFENIKCIPYNIQLDYIRGAISKGSYKVVEETNKPKVFIFTYKDILYTLEVNKIKNCWKREYRLDRK